MKKNILAIFFSLLIGLGLTEITLQLFFPIEDPYKAFKQGKRLSLRYIESQFEPDQSFRFYSEPGLSGLEDSSRFTTDNYGFRGPYLEIPKPKNEYRIFMVGGSTTECMFLDDSLAVTQLLQDDLNQTLPDSIQVKVYNAGKSGDKSYDHLAMISQRILHLQPDMIIVFAGLNDLTAALYNVDYSHKPVYEVHPALNFINMARYFLTQFQVPRRLYYLFQPIFGKKSDEEIQMAISFKSNYKKLVALREKHPVSDKHPRTDLEPYERNMQSIIGLAKIHNIKLVLMTQAVTWNSQIDPEINKWHWITYKNGTSYREDYMDQALEQYNGVTKKLGQEFDIPVFDLAAVMPKSSEYFYDDCHFNIEGSKRAARLLSDFILKNEQIH